MPFKGQFFLFIVAVDMKLKEYRNIRNITLEFLQKMIKEMQIKTNFTAESEDEIKAKKRMTEFPRFYCIWRANRIISLFIIFYIQTKMMMKNQPLWV